MLSMPKRFPDRVEIASVRAEAEPLGAGEESQEKRRLAGRVMGRRDMGKLVFLDLVDRSGRIQLLCDTSRTGELDIHLGDVVGVTGSPARARRGEPSLAVDAIELLSRIRSPLPDTFHGLTDVEARYRRRHLDLLMNEETRADFVVRTRIVTAIRRYLDAEGFLEVETPVLQPRYGGAFARPFETYHNELDQTLYLRIATELYLKRLIVGGLERVYELGKDFRNEGISYKHNPEFTMLEWYEAYADYEDGMRRIEQLVEQVARETLGRTTVTFRGHQIDLAGPWRRVSFVDALRDREVWAEDEPSLRGLLDKRGVDTSKDKDWAQLVDHAFTHFVEPSLIGPTIVKDYPIALSPFARLKDDDSGLVERFEFFVGGMELGNAFTEINDAEEQAERFRSQQELVEGETGDPEYVEALSYGMPPTSGLGLGIDRLAMVLSGRESIRDVILFPALGEPKLRRVPLSLPDTWYWPPIAQLVPIEWWISNVEPDAGDLVAAWASIRWDAGHQLAAAEGRLLKHRSRPGGPKWFDLTLRVPEHVARPLDALVLTGAMQEVVNSVRPDAYVVGDNPEAIERARGVTNGLVVLSAVRSGLTEQAENIREAWLRLSQQWQRPEGR